jgi:hypothetical protein
MLSHVTRTGKDTVHLNLSMSKSVLRCDFIWKKNDYTGYAMMMFHSERKIKDEG